LLATAISVSVTGFAFGQTTSPAPGASEAPEEIVVTAKRLDTARDSIAPSWGPATTSSTASRSPTSRRASIPLQSDTVAGAGRLQDSFGQLHLRNEHGNLQYRINGVILPEGISGFGQALDPRFADSIDLITGTLPAQYGYRTAGVVAITTKRCLRRRGNGQPLRGSAAPSNRPSPPAGRRQVQLLRVGQLSREDLGVENRRLGQRDPRHSSQTMASLFVLHSVGRHAHLGDVRHLDRLFQIPNNPGQTANFTAYGVSDFNSADPTRTSARSTTTPWSPCRFRATSWTIRSRRSPRFSETKFSPDRSRPDLQRLFRPSQLSSWSSGIQADAKYALSDSHTIRAGLFLSGERTISQVTWMSSCSIKTAMQSGDIPTRLHDQQGKPVGSTASICRTNGRSPTD